MVLLLLIAQLCELVPDTTPAYWAELRVKGTGPPYIKLSHKKVVYPEDKLQEWLESRLHTSTRDGSDAA
ncbi:helix-turn-helix transcriptional regulator [Leifsonia poae]|uniref:helix-turn-helix transcriptional regulator n=1 Tax=Leifsonia poae TaxID=110933 RepID=UPI003D67D987